MTVTDKKADILDSCLEKRRQGKDVSDILREESEATDEIRNLMMIVSRLQDLRDPPESRAGLMRALVESEKRKKEHNAKSHAPPTLFSRPVFMRAAALLLIVLFLGWSTVTASASAVPGSLLYPVKRLTERVRFYLTINDNDRVELRLVFSQERLKELVKLHQEKGELNTQLLSSMLEEARQALANGGELPETSRALLVPQARYMSRYQHDVLQKMEDEVPPNIRERLRPYVKRVNQRCNWMEEAPVGEPEDKNRPSRRYRQREWKNWMRKCPR